MYQNKSFFIFFIFLTDNLHIFFNRIKYMSLIIPQQITYPREDSEKFYTDKFLMHIISNRQFYETVIESVEKALVYFNQCKEYYFVFYMQNYGIKKRYSGRQIKELMSVRGANILNVNKIDQLYYFIFKNRDKFLKIYKSIEHAKKHYNNVTEYSVSVDPPSDFYDKVYFKNFSYNIGELLDIHGIAVKEKNNNFPIPVFWK